MENEGVGGLSFHFVSCICGEIIATESIEFAEAAPAEETLTPVVFKTFTDFLYDNFHDADVSTCNNTWTNSAKSSLFWQYGPKDFLKIRDFFTVSAFLNLAPTHRQTLFLLIDDVAQFSQENRKFLELQDLFEVRDRKLKSRTKYDLKTGVEDIEEQIKIIQQELLCIDNHKKIFNNILKKEQIEKAIQKESIFFSLKEVRSIENLKALLEAEKSGLQNIKESDNFGKRSSLNSEEEKEKTSEESFQNEKPAVRPESVVFLKQPDPFSNDYSSTKSSERTSLTSELYSTIVKEAKTAIQEEIIGNLKEVKKAGHFSKENEFPGLNVARLAENEQLKEILRDTKIETNEKGVLVFALRKMSPAGKCYTADLCSGYSIIDCLKKVSGGRRMKDSGRGGTIECSMQMTTKAPVTDIYFLEADTQTRRCTQHKTEERNLENLFISPAGREMLKYKPTTKMKHTTRFQPQTNPSSTQIFTTTRPPSLSTISRPEPPAAKSCGSSSSSSSPSTSTSSNQYFSHSTSIRPLQSCSSCGTPSSQESSVSSSRQSSIDLLYEEAAAILGLTCAQTDDCRCIECQCHYFDDFEESEIDFSERVINVSPGPPGNDFCSSSSLLNRDLPKVGVGVGGSSTSTPAPPSSQESTCAIQ